MATSSGMTSTPANTLGATRYCMGLTAIVSRASICSVIRISPISAVIAEPARPVTISAESTGPSSRMMLSATAEPRRPSAPNLRNE